MNLVPGADRWANNVFIG